MLRHLVASIETLSFHFVWSCSSLCAMPLITFIFLHNRIGKISFDTRSMTNHYWGKTEWKSALSAGETMMCTPAEDKQAFHRYDMSITHSRIWASLSSQRCRRKSRQWKMRVANSKWFVSWYSQNPLQTLIPSLTNSSLFCTEWVTERVRYKVNKVPSERVHFYFFWNVCFSFFLLFCLFSLAWFYIVRSISNNIVLFREHESQ